MTAIASHSEWFYAIMPYTCFLGRAICELSSATSAVRSSYLQMSDLIGHFEVCATVILLDESRGG